LHHKTKMKFFLPILLLINTAFYVLPVKEILTEQHSIGITDLDELKEENHQKEKAKELFSFSNIYIIIKDNYSTTNHYISFTIPVLLQSIETPPPDLV